MIITDRARLDGRRLVAACGLVAVALTLPAFVLVPPAPAVGAGTDRILDYYQDLGTRFLVFGWLTGLSIPFLVAHLAAVADWLRRRDLPGLAAAYLAGGLMAHTVQLVLLAVFQLAGMAAAGGDPAAARTLSDLGNVGFSFYALAEVVRLGAGAVAIRRTGVVARWLAWPAVGTAALCVLGSVGVLARSGPMAAGNLPVVAWYLAFLLTFSAVNLALLRPAREAP
jgi:hypothetical protein